MRRGLNKAGAFIADTWNIATDISADIYHALEGIVEVGAKATGRAIASGWDETVDIYRAIEYASKVTYNETKALIKKTPYAVSYAAGEGIGGLLGVPYTIKKDVSGGWNATGLKRTRSSLRPKMLRDHAENFKLSTTYSERLLQLLRRGMENGADAGHFLTVLPVSIGPVKIHAGPAHCALYGIGRLSRALSQSEPPKQYGLDDGETSQIFWDSYEGAKKIVKHLGPDVNHFIPYKEMRAQRTERQELEDMGFLTSIGDTLLEGDYKGMTISPDTPEYGIAFFPSLFEERRVVRAALGAYDIAGVMQSDHVRKRLQEYGSRGERERDALSAYSHPQVSGSGSLRYVVDNVTV